VAAERQLAALLVALSAIHHQESEAIIITSVFISEKTQVASRANQRRKSAP
jgi:hypothetical protein